MKATTLIRNIIIMTFLVGLIKVSGVGDFVVDMVEDPASSVPNVEINR